jgi:hypothetical protein
MYAFPRDVDTIQNPHPDCQSTAELVVHWYYWSYGLGCAADLRWTGAGCAYG